MRVVAGRYRGKKLKEFDIETTRPTLDRVKESIFNLIQFDVPDSVVLDLFSGTGALGIEAISRGAEKVIMVDSNKLAINVIKQNLVGIEGCYEVVQQDYETFLKTTDIKFDIVLLDPPYATEFGINAINLLIERNLLNDKAIIIFETAYGKELKLNEESFDITIKKYGTVAVYKLIKKV